MLCDRFDSIRRTITSDTTFVHFFDELVIVCSDNSKARKWASDMVINHAVIVPNTEKLEIMARGHFMMTGREMISVNLDEET